jgi:hypothetical protein
MRFARLIPAASVVLALGVAGCGDSTSGGASTVTITNTEALEMWSEVGDAIGSAFAQGSASRMGGPALSRMSLPELDKLVSINVSANCPSGGTVGVSGSENATGTTGASFDFTLAFTTCKTTHFTLGGSLEYKGSETASASSFNISYTVTGSVTVTATDGRTGTCGFDFTVTVTSGANASNATVSVSGTFCGLQANSVITTANA